MFAKRRFLTAEWRHLVMLNYRVEPELLLARVPEGTELDTWNGAVYISVIGFLFQRTRLLGIPVPFHRNFEEVNLRFYVRRTVGDEVRRGVTFIREVVPKVAIAAIARLAYNEPYVALPMRHSFAPVSEDSGTFNRLSYQWQSGRTWNGISVVPIGQSIQPEPGSLEEFITEHYWGYTAQRDGGTVEYQVEHPPWRVWKTKSAALTGDHRALYGDPLAAALSAPPDSAFVAQGSAVSVYMPRRIA